MDFAAKLLNDVPSLAMLRAGFRLGVWSRLRNGSLPSDTLSDAFLVVCRAAGMVTGDDDVALTKQMAALLDHQPDLRARAEFTALAACDLLDRGEALLAEPDAFRAGARTFGFFRYDRAAGTGAAHLEDTAPWVSYVTALARIEAPALVSVIPLDGVRHLLEVGGNTGAFARTLLAENPDLRITVLDLPAVCRLGEAQGDMDGRLRFQAGDARQGDWPAADGVLFKSVLHDWAEDAACALLDNAAKHVGPEGRVIVCERGPVAEMAEPLGMAQAANLVFAAHYRAPDLYRDRLAAAGLAVWPPRSVVLDMHFHVTCAGRAP